MSRQYRGESFDEAVDRMTDGVRQREVDEGRIDRPGVYKMAMDAYQADPCPAPSLSSGIAHRLITQSPLHAWHAHPRLNPAYVREEDTAFDLGSCAHALLLEGDGAIVSLDYADWRKKEAQQERAAVRQAGKIPVLAHKYQECLAMAEVARAAIRNCGDVHIDLAEGRAEHVIAWQEEAGAWCRARPDWHSNDRTVFLDYKSTSGSAEPNAWIRNQMGPMGYDVQAVHYQRGNVRTGGPAHAQWLFLVQENYPPYCYSFVGLSPAMREIAQRKWDFALALWTHCTKVNVWKGYPNVIAYAEPTAWQMSDDEERRLTFDEMLELASA